MASTQLQLINRIMRRLREDQVTASSDSDYSELISEFIKEAYEVALEDHMWSSLTHTVVVDVAAGTANYDLTRLVSSGGNLRNTTTRLSTVESELSFTREGAAEISVYTDDSDTTDNGAVFVDPITFRALQAGERTLTNSEVQWITLEKDVDTTATPDVQRLYMRIYPIPSASRVVELTFWTPPVALEVDGTTDTTTLLIPERPVFLYALMLALNERGEEIGEPGNVAERNWNRALGAAIEKDIANDQRANRYEWVRS